MEAHPEITKETVKKMKGWENMPDEFAEKIVRTVKKLTEIFYVTISRELSLAPIPIPENQNPNSA